MNTLLNKVIVAHGGMTNWRACRIAEAAAVFAGDLCPNGPPAMPRKVRVLIHVHKVSIEPLGCPDCRSELDRNRLSVAHRDGSLVTGFDDVHLMQLQFKLPIDPLMGVLLTCATARTLLTSPFILTSEGVEISELVPWNEAGHQWRVLRVEFPRELAIPARIQDYFFDADFLLRRHDYHVDGRAGITITELVTDYTEVNGIKMPTKLSAYPRLSDLTPDFDRTLINIHASSLQFS